MIKTFWWGAACAALLSAPAAAAPPPRAEAPAWVIAPAAGGCRTDFEMTGTSGATVSAAFVSDGAGVDLVFAKADAPEQAFLPIRIDQKPFANLVLRQKDGRSAAIRLSPESLAALRKGGALQVGWLAQEPVQVGLAGSDQALSDLRTCGAQVAEQSRAQETARREAQARADAEARAKAVADEQLAAARAQKDAADAERERASAEAERLRAEAEALRDRSQQQARADAYGSDARPETYGAYGAYDADERRDEPTDPYAGRYVPSPYRRW